MSRLDGTTPSAGEVLDDVIRTSATLVIQRPFFGSYLVGLDKRIEPRVHDVELGFATTQPLIRINPEAWPSLSRDERRGALEHELLHLILKHPFRADQFGDRARFNLAADLVVVQHLFPHTLRASDVRLSDFDLPAHRTLEYYYRALSNVGSGTDRLDPRHPLQQRHAGWRSLGRRSRLERSAATSELERHLERALRSTSPADLPHGLREELTVPFASRTSRLDWRRVLRTFAASSGNTVLKHTSSRPSRRYGTRPGIKVRPKRRIVVALDTSGSVDRELITTFFAEIHQIARFAEVTVVECDDAVRAVYAYGGAPPDVVQGRGCTAFDPPLGLANARLRPDALVYLTDGQGEAPSVAPRYPVLWLIPGARAEACASFPGRVVAIPTLSGFQKAERAAAVR